MATDSFCRELGPDVVFDCRGVHVDIGESRSLSFCDDCFSSVRRRRVPPFSLANHNVLGDVPTELRDLTFIEEQLVALCRAKGCIVHLKDDGGLSSTTDTAETSRRPNAQRGFKGHIIVYPQRPEDVADVLPRPMTDVLTPLCVIFVGSRPPTLQWLREKAAPLIVRREKVRSALCWLRIHNRLYAHVHIDDSNLAALPEDDVLPVHVEHVQPSAAQDALTSRYDLSGSPPQDDEDEDLHLSSRSLDSHQVPFSHVVVTDVDGRAPANELRAAAVRHIKEKGGGYLEVPHGPRPVNEFCNPTLFPQLYPCLFPYGVGGFEDDRRPTALGFQRHVRH
ncbi:hypothetical protein LXA43DRAFT_904714, partial [Ganoderma leucocontextum]